MRMPASFRVLRRSMHAPDGHDTAVRELLAPTTADLDEFRRGIEPLASSGKLGPVLAQFPPSFKSSPVTKSYLSLLLTALRDYPVAVELRHAPAHMRLI